MTPILTRFLKAAAGALLTAALLAGCANASTDLRPDTAAKLQARLQSLARSAADKDVPAARTELDLLAGDVATAAANGGLSAGRRQDIQNAIDLIRADLTAMTATPTSTPAPTPGPALQTPAPTVPQPPVKGKGNGKEDTHSTED